VPEKSTQGIRLRRAELAREEAYGSHVWILRGRHHIPLTRS
jgi:hypothetical protein